jgi:predicted PurR-regulated permease PerM
LTRIDLASYLLAGAALFVVVKFGLLGALLAGLMVHETVLLMAPWLRRSTGLGHELGKAAALVLFSAVISLAIAAVVIAALPLLTNGSESVAALLTKMSEVVAEAKSYLPQWAARHLPHSTDDLQAAAAKMLQDHAWELQRIGTEVGRVLVHVLFGLIIGGLLLFRRSLPHRPAGPLAVAMGERAQRLASAFRRVVFAQIRISALNTTLTGLYLAGILPWFGVELPLVKTMIAVTFVVGLLPVIGNIISNTVIVVVSLSVSAAAAAGSLAFLVFIHKLEYFINARIIGTRINARAWELLTAMLVMDTLFGIPGLIAAPILYAYLKEELTSRGLI